MWTHKQTGTQARDRYTACQTRFEYKVLTQAKYYSKLHYWYPRVQKNKKWKSAHAGYESYQLISASQSANHGWIGWHWFACNSYFPHRRIFISCFSEPLGINIEGFNSLLLGIQLFIQISCDRVWFGLHLILTTLSLSMSTWVNLLTSYSKKWLSQI